MDQRTRRKKEILDALKELGGTASTHQLAIATGFNTNGLSQTLNTMPQVSCLGGRGGECQWQLKE